MIDVFAERHRQPCLVLYVLGGDTSSDAEPRLASNGLTAEIAAGRTEKPAAFRSSRQHLRQPSRPLDHVAVLLKPLGLTTSRWNELVSDPGPWFGTVAAA